MTDDMTDNEVRALRSALQKTMEKYDVPEKESTQAAAHSMGHSHSISKALADTSGISFSDSAVKVSDLHYGGQIVTTPHTNPSHQHSIINTPSVQPGFIISSGTGQVVSLPSQTAVTVDGQNQSPKEILQSAKDKLIQVAKELKDNLDEAEKRWLDIERDFIEAGKRLQELDDALAAIDHAQTEPDTTDDWMDDEGYEVEESPEQVDFDESVVYSATDDDIPF